MSAKSNDLDSVSSVGGDDPSSISSGSETSPAYREGSAQQAPTVNTIRSGEEAGKAQSHAGGPRGIRDPRSPRSSRPMLDDPRKPANRDLLALERRRLWIRATDVQPLAAYPYFTDRDIEKKNLKSGLATDLKTVFHVPTSLPADSKKENPPALAVQTDDSDGSLTLLVYRYTKQVEVINDEMGYGERLVEEFYQPADTLPKQLQRVLRVSQRTKTGRQQLFVDHDKLHDELVDPNKPAS